MTDTRPPVEAAPTTESDRWANEPWWRRPRRIDRQFAGALVVVALLAVATFGGLNYVAARDLLVRGTESQLADVGASRAVAIENGSARLTAEVASVSADLAVATALDQFTTAFTDLDDEQLEDAQRDELTQWYQTRIVDPLNEAGLGPYTTDDVLPTTSAAWWLQYHYTARPSGEAPPADAGDGTAYSELNAAVTPIIEGLSDALAAGDILLIDDQGTIVYSLDKRNDVGTNLVTGPYAGSPLARAVTEALPRARAGTAVLTSYAVSQTGRAALFAVSSVRNGSEVLGAFGVEVPVTAINAVATSGGGWEEIGLRDGDVYLVGSDGTLQSEPRAWVEDPEAYLDALRSGDETEQTEARLIELFGSPVGIQVIDTEPVRTALDGGEYRDSARNDAGEPTYAASQSLNVGGQQWVVVSEVPRSSVLEPLTSYLGDIALVLLIVLPIVAGLGVWLARRLTRPIRPLVAAADEIAAGDRSPDVDTTTRDEFGDLARRLTVMADSLAEHERELTSEYESTRRLLLAVLPAALVDSDGTVVGTGEAAEEATVVAVTAGAATAADDEGEVAEALAVAASLAEDIAERIGLQRVRAGADRYLLVAGMGSPDSGADDALTFADELRRRLPEQTDVPLRLQVGLSSGVVATGVLDTGSLSFGAWGDPVRRALALASLATQDTVLVDRSTADGATGMRWSLVPAHDVVALDGAVLDLLTLDPEAEAAVPVERPT